LPYNKKYKTKKEEENNGKSKAKRKIGTTFPKKSKNQINYFKLLFNDFQTEELGYCRVETGDGK
jgi:hypothetical protein